MKRLIPIICGLLSLQLFAPRFTLHDTVESQHEEKAIPIVGSPRLAPYDLLIWQAQIEALMRDRDWKGGNYSKNPARTLDFAFGQMLLTTPPDYNKHKTREQVLADLSS